MSNLNGAFFEARKNETAEESRSLTVGLKSLLQNSELLELLMKPLEAPTNTKLPPTSSNSNLLGLLNALPSAEQDPTLKSNLPFDLDEIFEHDFLSKFGGISFEKTLRFSSKSNPGQKRDN